MFVGRGPAHARTKVPECVIEKMGFFLQDSTGQSKTLICSFRAELAPVGKRLSNASIELFICGVFWQQKRQLPAAQLPSPPVLPPLHTPLWWATHWSSTAGMAGSFIVQCPCPPPCVLSLSFMSGGPGFFCVHFWTQKCTQVFLCKIRKHSGTNMVGRQHTSCNPWLIWCDPE